MASDAGQTTARQWAMLRGIPRGPMKITSAELESKLNDEGYEVSRRTIERDLVNLSAQFPLVVDDSEKPYGWSWAKNANFEFMPKLTPSQAVALLLARTHLRDLLPQTMHKELVPIFDAAQQTLSNSGWKDWHRRTAVVPMGIAHIPPKLSSDVLTVIQSALAHRHCISAQYRTKGSKDAKQWKVHPLGIMSRGPVLYLICTLFDYGNVLQLALHRFSKAVETDEPIKEPSGFDFQEWIRENARQFNSQGRIKLVAIFESQAANHLKEMPLSEDQVLQDVEEGRVQISATVENDELLRWWLMAFGSQVEVVKPTSLKDWMRNEAEATASVYSR